MSIFSNYFGPNANKPEVQERFDDAPPLSKDEFHPDILTKDQERIKQASEKLNETLKEDGFLVALDIAKAFDFPLSGLNGYRFISGDYDRWKEYVEFTLTEVQNEIEISRQVIDKYTDHLEKLQDKKEALEFALRKDSNNAV